MTLKRVDRTPMSWENVSDLFSIVLSFSVTRNNATLFSSNHEFCWLNERGTMNDSFPQTRKRTIVGSYSSDMAPRACSNRPFFSISKIKVSAGSDNFLVSHQRTWKLDENVLHRSQVSLTIVLLFHQLIRRRILFQILIVTKSFCKPDHDGCSRSVTVRRRRFLYEYRRCLSFDDDRKTKLMLNLSTDFVAFNETHKLDRYNSRPLVDACLSDWIRYKQAEIWVSDEDLVWLDFLFFFNREENFRWRFASIFSEKRHSYLPTSQMYESM